MEQSRTRSMINKSFMSMSHALDRDMKLEDEHTIQIVTHAKRIRSLGVGVLTAIENRKRDDDPDECFDFIAKYVKETMEARQELETFYMVPSNMEEEEEEISASATWQDPNGHTLGNPHDERGQGDTASEAYARLPDCPVETEEIKLKDPPEYTLPVAKCDPIESTDTKQSQSSFFDQVSRGKAAIALPLKTPEPEMMDSEEEIDFQNDMEKAKEMSLKELERALSPENTAEESDTVIETEIQVGEDTGVSNLTVPPPETQPVENNAAKNEESTNSADDDDTRVSHGYNTRARKSLNPTETK